MSTLLLAAPKRNFFIVLRLAFLVAGFVIVATPTPASACGDGRGHDEEHQCPFALDGIEVTALNLSNGARLTVTSDNEDNVEVIHAWAVRHAEGQGCRHHGMEGVEVSSETLSNGARLTFTSDDSETVSRIQEMVRQRAAGEGCGHSEGTNECGCEHHCSGDCNRK